MAAQITLKSNAILLALVALVTTMNFSILGYALNWLHVSDKIVHLLLMTYRYVFVIDQEYQRLIRAARIRGFQPGTNLHTYKTYAYHRRYASCAFEQSGPIGSIKPCFAGGLNANFIVCMNLMHRQTTSGCL